MAQVNTVPWSVTIIPGVPRQPTLSAPARAIREVACWLRIPTKLPRCTDMKSPVDSETMAPTFRFDLAQPRGVLARWGSGIPRGQFRIDFNLLFFVCGCCGHAGNAVALSKRSGMSTRHRLTSFARMTGPAQALAGEIEPTGVEDKTIERDVGGKSGPQSARAMCPRGAGWWRGWSGGRSELRGTPGDRDGCRIERDEPRVVEDQQIDATKGAQVENLAGLMSTRRTPDLLKRDPVAYAELMLPSAPSERICSSCRPTVLITIHRTGLRQCWS